MWLAIDLSEHELEVLARWRRDFLSPGVPTTLESVLHDILLRIEDEMNESQAT